MTTILQTAPEPQDSILALAPKADESADNLGFDRVLERTAYEEVQENTDNEKSEKNAAAAEREASTVRANAKELGGMMHTSLSMSTKLASEKAFGSTIAELMLVNILNSRAQRTS